MNIILNDSNNNVGGIEVMFIEITKYLINKNHNVYFIVNENSIYEKELQSLNNVFFIRKNSNNANDPIDLMSLREIKEERDFILSQFNLKEDYYVISPYYHKLQYAMAMFKANNNFKLLNLWPHPQHWANQLKIKPSKIFVKKIRKTSKYYYQRNLLNVLEQKNAQFYAARVVPIFNNWYYSISLNPNVIETLPIQPTTVTPKNYNIERRINTIKILWCGRFTYFKNEAIIEVSRVLDNLAKTFPEYKIEYGIIGYGSENDTNYIKKNIRSESIEVSYLGVVNSDELAKVFKEYDIGVGMGLTVKKMAQVGLPSIVVDSFEKKSEHKKNCNWLFDTSEGDAGDGYYYRIANEIIENRQELSEVLSEVMENPYLLEVYSQKCIDYVEKNYSFETQLQAIIDAAKSSKFIASDYPVFRRNIALRILYSVYKKIKLLKN